MASDIRMVRLTATGSAFAGPARLKALSFVTATGTPRVTLTDGSGGATLLDLDAHSAANTIFVELPEQGILFPNALWVATLTNVSAITLFYA